MKSQLLLFNFCEHLSKISNRMCTMEVTYQGTTYIPGSGSCLSTPNLSITIKLDGISLFKEEHIKDPAKNWNDDEVKDTLADKILLMIFTSGIQSALSAHNQIKSSPGHRRGA